MQAALPTPSALRADHGRRRLARGRHDGTGRRTAAARYSPGQWVRTAAAGSAPHAAPRLRHAVSRGMLESPLAAHIFAGRACARASGNSRNGLNGGLRGGGKNWGANTPRQQNPLISVDACELPGAGMIDSSPPDLEGSHATPRPCSRRGKRRPSPWCSGSMSAGFTWTNGRRSIDKKSAPHPREATRSGDTYINKATSVGNHGCAKSVSPRRTARCLVSLRFCFFFSYLWAFFWVLSHHAGQKPRNERRMDKRWSEFRIKGREQLAVTRSVVRLLVNG